MFPTFWRYRWQIWKGLMVLIGCGLAAVLALLAVNRWSAHHWRTKAEPLWQRIEEELAALPDLGSVDLAFPVDLEIPGEGIDSGRIFAWAESRPGERRPISIEERGQPFFLFWRFDAWTVLQERMEAPDFGREDSRCLARVIQEWRSSRDWVELAVAARLAGELRRAVEERRLGPEVLDRSALLPTFEEVKAAFLIHQAAQVSYARGADRPWWQLLAYEDDLYHFLWWQGRRALQVAEAEDWEQLLGKDRELAEQIRALKTDHSDWGFLFHSDAFHGMAGARYEKTFALIRDEIRAWDGLGAAATGEGGEQG